MVKGQHKLLSDTPSEEELKILEEERIYEENKLNKPIKKPRYNPGPFFRLKFETPEQIKLIKWCAVRKGYFADDYSHKEDPNRQKTFSRFCADILVNYSKTYHKKLKDELIQQHKIIPKDLEEVSNENNSDAITE